MKDGLRNILGKKMGKAILGTLIIFVLATSAYGTAVQVINFPVLMTMIQKMVTGAITDEIKSVWDKEVKIKLEPGSINTKAVSFIKYSMTSSTEQMISKYMKNNTGVFSKSAGKYFSQVARSAAPVVIPSTSIDFKEYQKKIREASILLAGAPGGGSEKIKHFTTAEYAAAKLRDSFNQASVAAYERAAEGVYIAEQYKKEMTSFDPSYIDNAKSDQAVKDLAKLTYYNAILQSEILAVMSRGEMRRALEGR